LNARVAIDDGEPIGRAPRFRSDDWATRTGAAAVERLEGLSRDFSGRACELDRQKFSKGISTQGILTTVGLIIKQMGARRTSEFALTAGQFNPRSRPSEQ
jgi:hypothetical protein